MNTMCTGKKIKLIYQVTHHPPYQSNTSPSSLLEYKIYPSTYTITFEFCCSGWACIKRSSSIETHLDLHLKQILKDISVQQHPLFLPRKGLWTCQGVLGIKYIPLNTHNKFVIPKFWHTGGTLRWYQITKLFRS